MENKSTNLADKIRNAIIGLCIASLPFAYAGCITTPDYAGSRNHAIEYGVLGARAGAIVGNQSHHRTGKGALIGGLIGTIIGSQVEK